MKIAVIIPSYKVKNHILQVIEDIGPEVSKIYVVDDKCPNESGKYVVQNCQDERVNVLFHEKNQGVGGAVKTGYSQALKDGLDIMVKIDGDGQMDSNKINQIVQPILAKEADYVKANRFFYVNELINGMPKIRLIGNSALSFINKIVSGYWDVMDPTNGYTAIHRHALSLLPLNKIANDYFFESDMLFRLGLIRAVVKDTPLKPIYEDEESNLSVTKTLFNFPYRYFKRMVKRFIYLYFIRDFNMGSFHFLIGSILLTFGGVKGSIDWYQSINTGILKSTGTVMISVLTLILGFQFLISSLNFDVQNTPTDSLQKNY